MARIVWIASYPRSGNTWLRFLLAHLLLGDIEQSAQVEATIPDIHLSLTREQLDGPSRIYIKTHWAWRSGFPLQANTDAVVYLLRNPIDVAESALNYALLTEGARARDATAEELQHFRRNFAEDYIDRGGDPVWLKFGFGSWSENVASWVDAALPFRRHIVNYESLRADTEHQLALIANFLELGPNAEQIERAVSRSSIQKLAAMEDEELQSQSPGLFYNKATAQSGQAGHRFIRRADGRRFSFSESERQQLRNRFGSLMERLGYR